MKERKFNVGDLVTQRYRPSVFGMVMKVYKVASNSHEYSVSWLQAHGRSRCAEGVLELVSRSK